MEVLDIAPDQRLQRRRKVAEDSGPRAIKGRLSAADYPAPGSDSGGLTLGHLISGVTAPLLRITVRYQTIETVLGGIHPCRAGFWAVTRSLARFYLFKHTRIFPQVSMWLQCGARSLTIEEPQQRNSLRDSAGAGTWQSGAAIGYFAAGKLSVAT